MSRVGDKETVLAYIYEAEDDDNSSVTALSMFKELSGRDDDHLAEYTSTLFIVEDLEAEGLLMRKEDSDEEITLSLTSSGKEKAKTAYQQIRNKQVYYQDEAEKKSITDIAQTEDDKCSVIFSNVTEQNEYSSDKSPEDGLIHRENEIQDIKESITNNACSESGSLIEIDGVRGVGKTALLHQIQEDIGDEFQTVYVQCHPNNEPFAGIKQVIQELLGVKKSDIFTDHGEGQGIDSAGQSKYITNHIFENVTTELSKAQNHCVIMFDDFQHIDKSTLEYIVSLVERNEFPRFTVVISHTHGDEKVQKSFNKVRSGSERIEIERLSKEGTRLLIEQVVGRKGCPESLAEHISAYTNGVPLYIELLVGDLLESEKLSPYYDWYPDSIDGQDISKKLESITTSQITDLPKESKLILQVLSLDDKPVQVDIIAQLTGITESQCGKIIDSLIKQGFVVETKDGFNYGNEIVKQSVITTLSEGEKNRLHREFATLISKDDTEISQLERAGVHFEEVDRPEDAVQCFFSAGEKAVEVCANEDARIIYDHGLKVALNNEMFAELVHAASEIIRIKIRLGEYDSCEKYVEYMEQYESDMDAPIKQKLFYITARVKRERGDHSSGLKSVNKGLELGKQDAEIYCKLLIEKVYCRTRVERDSDEEPSICDQIIEIAKENGLTKQVAAGLYVRANYERYSGNYDTAISYIKEALDIVEEHNLINHKLDLYGKLASLYEKTEQLEKSIAIQSDRLELARETNNKNQEADALNLLGNALKGKGEREKAIEKYTQALEIADKIGKKQVCATVKGNLASAKHRRGEMHEAIELTEDAIDYLTANNHSWNASAAYINLTGYYRVIGDYDTAKEKIELALEIAEDIGDEHLLGTAKFEQGAMYILEADYDTAIQILSSSKQHYENVDRNVSMGGVLGFIAKAEVQRGDIESAKRTATKSLKILQQCKEDGGTVHRAFEPLGDIAYAEGKYETALAYYNNRLDALEEYSRPPLPEAGKKIMTLVKLGKEDQADELYKSAIESLEENYDAYPLLAGKLALSKAMIETEKGNSEKAAQKANEAHEIFTRVGLPYWKQKTSEVRKSISCSGL